MKKFRKSFLMLLMLLCMFGYMGVAKADEQLSKVENSTVMNSVYNLLTGKSLSDTDKNNITTLQGKYTLYYKYAEIDSETYSKYKQDTTNSEVGNSIGGLIPAPSSEDLEGDNGWTKIEGTQVSYSDLNYDASNPVGYVVALAAAAQNGTIYVSRNVFQSTSATTLATYSSIANVNDSDSVVEKENDGEEEEGDSEEEEEEGEDEGEEEKSESNPETGISDFAVYLVPVALVAGSTLYLRRRIA